MSGVSRTTAQLVGIVLVIAACSATPSVTAPAPSPAVRPSANSFPTATTVPPWATATPAIAVGEPSSTPPAAPTSTAQPELTAPPVPTPPPTAAMTLIVDGHRQGKFALAIDAGDHRDVKVVLKLVNVERARCVIIHRVVPDAPGTTSTKTRLAPKRRQTVALIDGLHTFRATCPSRLGDLQARVKVLATDGQPELCQDFTFAEAPASVASLAELNAGIVGTWTGCVTTPWTPSYYVTVSFRSDGTYSAISSEVLDGVPMNAMYYGIETGSPAKRYELDDLQDDLEGVGWIDIDFGAGSIDRDDLRDVRLMGDQLEFEVIHGGIYGPLTFELYRR